jgi:hypothetical protein
MKAAFEGCKVMYYGLNSFSASQLDTWFANSTKQGYRVQSVTSPSQNEIDTVYAYEDGGAQLTVRYHQNNFPQEASRTMYTCLAVPAGITVLDVTPDGGGKAATTIYRFNGARVPKLIADLISAGAFRSNEATDHAVTLPWWTEEHQAKLQKLNATGWRADPASLERPGTW